jgi:hypothetical protein
MIGPEGTFLGREIGILAGMTVAELIANITTAIIDVAPYIAAYVTFSNQGPEYEKAASAALILASINLVVDLSFPFGIELFAKKALERSPALKVVSYVATFVAQFLAIGAAEAGLVDRASAMRTASLLGEMSIEGADLKAASATVNSLLEDVNADTDLGLVYQFGSVSGLSYGATGAAPPSAP